MFDFAIIGGGLIGPTVARVLALEKLSVILLDEGDRAFRAARGNFALIWGQAKGMGMVPYANWTRRSVSLWPDFVHEIEAESELDLALHQPGGFHLALTEQELTHLASNAAAINAQPGVMQYPYEVLDGDEIRRRLAGAGPEIVGGTYCPLDGHVNALRLFHGLHRAMIRSGVEYRANQRIERIECQKDFRLTPTHGVQIEARSVLLAAGLDNARLAPMVGLDAPVRPQRGQIIVTERTAPFLEFPISTLRQTDEGSLLIGDSQEETGLSDSVSCGVASVMASRAIRMFPRIATLSVVRSWDCWRVLSPDGFPIYDQSTIYPGAFLASCHSGVTLAAAHARLLAPAIARGSISEDLRPFSSGRFLVPSLS